MPRPCDAVWRETTPIELKGKEGKDLVNCKHCAAAGEEKTLQAKVRNVKRHLKNCPHYQAHIAEHNASEGAVKKDEIFVSGIFCS